MDIDDDRGIYIHMDLANFLEFLKGRQFIAVGLRHLDVDAHTFIIAV